jgi:hypothetical protein
MSTVPGSRSFALPANRAGNDAWSPVLRRRPADANHRLSDTKLRSHAAAACGDGTERIGDGPDGLCAGFRGLVDRRGVAPAPKSTLIFNPASPERQRSIEIRG